MPSSRPDTASALAGRHAALALLMAATALAAAGCDRRAGEPVQPTTSPSTSPSTGPSTSPSTTTPPSTMPDSPASAASQ